MFTLATTLIARELLHDLGRPARGLGEGLLERAHDGAEQRVRRDALRLRLELDVEVGATRSSDDAHHSIG
nr:hypothetical protein [Saccharothrix sp. NRRL B-16314]